MTPREGFVSICLILTKIDGVIHNEEIGRISKIINRYGYRQDEIEEVKGILQKRTDIEAYEIAFDTLDAINRLTDPMKRNLLEALKYIAKCDGRSDPKEIRLIQVLNNLFNGLYAEAKAST